MKGAYVKVEGTYFLSTNTECQPMTETQLIHTPLSGLKENV